MWPCNTYHRDDMGPVLLSPVQEHRESGGRRPECAEGVRCGPGGHSGAQERRDRKGCRRGRGAGRGRGARQDGGGPDDGAGGIRRGVS